MSPISCQPQIAGRCRAEKKISEDDAKQTVNCRLGQRVEDAQDHLEGNPGERKPAHPVVAAEHVHSADDRQETEQFDPYEVVLKRMVCLELGEVIGEANRARHHIHTGDDGHGKGTLLVMSCLSWKWRKGSSV